MRGLEEKRVLDHLMLKINDLPKIDLESISSEVTRLLREDKVQFKSMEEAPWFIKKLSVFCNDLYIGYKDTVYVPIGHEDVAQSKDAKDRVIAASKLIPWVYAVRNGSVSTLFGLLNTLFSTQIRSYYFLYEYALLKSHELPEIPELVATGFISTRRNFFGVRKNPDKVLVILKAMLASKILVKTSPELTQTS